MENNWRINGGIVISVDGITIDNSSTDKKIIEKKEMMKWIRILLTVGLIITGNNKVLANEGKGFYVTPPFTDVEIKPDQSESFLEIEIGNKSQKEATFEISVVDFGSLDETGGLAFITANSDKNERKYALASWISLEKNTVTVLPGKNEKVKITILNKESLSPGGHYGAVLATVKSDDQNNSDSVGINQSLASLIYVLKTGGEKTNLMFKSVEYDKNLFKFPKTVKLRFWNNGNVHVVPRGTVEIKNQSGKIIAQGIINGNSSKILPESFRILDLPIKKIKWWNWPGKYRLEINYRYDGSDGWSNMKTEIFYVGYEGILIGLVISGLLAVFWRKFT